MTILAKDQQLPPHIRKRRTLNEVDPHDGVVLPQPMKNSDDDYSERKLVLPENETFDSKLDKAGKDLDREPKLSPINWMFVGLLTIASYATRFYKITAGNFVLWDEAHFGKFASYYLRRTFYFDVHPPLGKMLVALGGLIAKVDKTFEFASGTTYPENVDYMKVRMFVAAFGTLAVPFTYMTAVQLRLGKYAAFLCATMALFENGLIGITRLILLDSFLLCFTSWTMFGYAWFRNQAKNPFGLVWWISMLFTGLSIGCVSSVKWVGFLVTAIVGLMTVEELWKMLGDIRMPKLTFIKHFLARCIGLIAVPVSIYMLSFYVHFKILNMTGPGDANMSSLFQAGLEGSSLQKSPVDVVIGSVITMKSRSFGGGLLHSHFQTYPTGSKQQQITTYYHKDENNEWKIIHSRDLENGQQENGELEYIYNGQLVRLRHEKTGRHLHSHPIAAPVTVGNFEVSCYGQDGHYDPNDIWQIEIVSDPSDSSPKRHLKNLLTSFRLKHVQTGCYLKSSNVPLPEWGFRQGEVSCERTTNPTSRPFLWNVETNQHEKLEPGNASLYKSRFLDNFRDCNMGMYITNNALRPDVELEPSILTSTPRDWFFMSKGIRMAAWDDEKTKFYMLGNPAVWPASTLCIIALALTLAAWVLLKHRQLYALLPSDWNYLTYQLKYCLGGWAMMYFPFYLQGRVLYLHHYYPALLFAILNAGLLFDMTTKRLSETRQKQLTALSIVIVIGVFIFFSPMAYGITGPASDFHNRKWFKTWNL